MMRVSSGEIRKTVVYRFAPRKNAALANAAPARRREVFRLMVERIELRFDHVKQGKKTSCPLQSGVIHLRTGEGTIFGSVSRGDRTAIELFLSGIRALTLQTSIIDVLRTAS
jgi:hypothetical protein